MLNPTQLGKRFNWRDSFSDVIAAGVNARWNLISTLGTGMAVSQAAGNLVITTGTNANQDTILRSADSFNGPVILSHQMTLSQRIANNSFFIELVDVLGDNLPFVINSATSVSVTVPQSVADKIGPNCIGQSMYLGGFIGTAGCIPARYAISAVVGNVITFTVASFPASGSGTVCLFGWNYYRTLYDGTTATSAKFDSQRNGWATGDTSYTTNTTAAPGTLGIIKIEDGKVSVFDQLVASSTALQQTLRASRAAMVPDAGSELYVQIRAVNGTTNPASTTTATVGFVDVEDYNPQVVSISGVRSQSKDSALPVTVENSPAPAAAPTVVIGQAAPTVSATLNQGPTLAIYRLISLATTNGNLVSTGVHRAVGGYVFNTSAATKFLKIYAKATAPTVGTDTPILTIPIAPSQGITLADVFSSFGLNIALGLGIAITGAAADADTTAVAAGDVILDLIYI